MRVMLPIYCWSQLLHASWYTSFTQSGVRDRAFVSSALALRRGVGYGSSERVGMRSGDCISGQGKVLGARYYQLCLHEQSFWFTIYISCNSVWSLPADFKHVPVGGHLPLWRGDTRFYLEDGADLFFLYLICALRCCRRLVGSKFLELQEENRRTSGTMR